MKVRSLCTKVLIALRLLGFSPAQRVGGVRAGLVSAGALVALLAGCSPGNYSGTENAYTSESRVASSFGDVEETQTGSILRSSPVLELTEDAAEQLVGLRFTGVDVPRGAVVTDAYLSFTASEPSAEATSLTVQGVAEDNPPAFISARFNVSSQTRTTAEVAWSVRPWLSPEAAGPEQRTPNLSPIVQELVNRPGWSRGNALAFVISGTGRRLARSFDSSRPKAPLLHVTFTSSKRVRVNFTAQPAAAPDRNSVTFSWSVTAPEGRSVSCTLDADGDGVLDYTTSDCLETGRYTHTYRVAGRYQATLSATEQNTETTATTEVVLSTPQSVTVAAAGDIACDPASEFFNGGAGTADKCHMKATSDILLELAPDAVLTLGDNQYSSATLENFMRSYHPTWGRLRAITHPAAGTHEYTAEDDEDDESEMGGGGNGAGYFAYFGAAAGRPSEGFYSFDLGTWHLVVLNTSCSRVGGCEQGSPQERWLRADLAANPKLCTLAVMHYPRFSSGKHGDTVRNTDIWTTLADAGVELVLSGNDHDYERFAPQTPSGERDLDKGIRQFVVGTGGKELYSFGVVRPYSEARIGGVYGVLKLGLHPESYDWEFVSEDGQRARDEGTTMCHERQR